ncbi:MAG TPA: hydroxymethylbilane synthase [Anaerolineae bacterium]|nr:hydroxymethylbilane synthase [Anaerolineae bacterium]
MIATKRATLTIGTRGSALARWQTDWVSARLKAAWPDLTCLLKLFQTSGDKILDKPLPEIGGKGLFTEELEDALRSGEIDLAVHSLKDLPMDDASGLVLGAIGEREDARDVLISRQYCALTSLPQDACVGTSSLRRSAQLLVTRPDLQILPLRGNVDTRIRKALQGEYDAIVLAAAGVLRLGLGSHIVEYLSFEIMLPAPGQGALAMQCRADDEATRALLQPIDHAPTRSAVTAERAFLAGLGGGCSAPIAAYAHSADSGQQSAISLTGLVASTDGRHVIRVTGLGTDSTALGNELAQQALARGAQELLT